eukprot:2582826-Amphidinium_carterae.1
MAHWDMKSVDNENNTSMQTTQTAPRGTSPKNHVSSVSYRAPSHTTGWPIAAAWMRTWCCLKCNTLHQKSARASSAGVLLLAVRPMANV